MQIKNRDETWRNESKPGPGQDIYPIAQSKSKTTLTRSVHGKFNCNNGTQHGKQEEIIRVVYLLTSQDLKPQNKG